MSFSEFPTALLYANVNIAILIKFFFCLGHLVMLEVPIVLVHWMQVEKLECQWGITFATNIALARPLKYWQLHTEKSKAPICWKQARCFLYKLEIVEMKCMSVWSFHHYRHRLRKQVGLSLLLNSDLGSRISWCHWSSMSQGQWILTCVDEDFMVIQLTEIQGACSAYIHVESFFRKAPWSDLRYSSPAS